MTPRRKPPAAGTRGRSGKPAPAATAAAIRPPRRAAPVAPPPGRAGAEAPRDPVDARAAGDDLLVVRALAAQEHAYAPYSRFQVGAALIAGDAVFVGANVENASYGLAICAERSAVTAAVYAGARVIDTIAIATSASPPSAPCGMCRQVLAEFAPDLTALRVIAINRQGERREWSLAELLPAAFSGKELP